MLESLSHLHMAGTACAWFALAGVFSGFFSGLLGLGGAFVLVPSFLAIFGAYYDFDNKSTLQLTLGTTMACMVVNVVCATLAQSAKRSVAWPPGAKKGVGGVKVRAQSRHSYW